MNKALRILAKVGAISSAVVPVAFPQAAPVAATINAVVESVKAKSASPPPVVSLILASAVATICMVESETGQELVDEEKFAEGLSMILSSIRGLQ